jgi:hypothetical protein
MNDLDERFDIVYPPEALHCLSLIPKRSLYDSFRHLRLGCGSQVIFTSVHMVSLPHEPPSMIRQSPSMYRALYRVLRYRLAHVPDVRVVLGFNLPPNHPWPTFHEFNADPDLIKRLIRVNETETRRRIVAALNHPEGHAYCRTVIVRVNLHHHHEMPPDSDPPFTYTAHATTLLVRRVGAQVRAVWYDSNGTTPHAYCVKSTRVVLRRLLRGVTTHLAQISDMVGPWGLQANEQRQLRLTVIRRFLRWALGSRVGLIRRLTSWVIRVSRYELEDPLFGQSGFCASWSLYFAFLVMINPHRTITDILLYTMGMGYVLTGTPSQRTVETFVLLKHKKLMRFLTLLYTMIPPADLDTGDICLLYFRHLTEQAVAPHRAVMQQAFINLMHSIQGLAPPLVEPGLDDNYAAQDAAAARHPNHHC